MKLVISLADQLGRQPLQPYEPPPPSYYLYTTLYYTILLYYSLFSLYYIYIYSSKVVMDVRRMKSLVNFLWTYGKVGRRTQDLSIYYWLLMYLLQ